MIRIILLILFLIALKCSAQKVDSVTIDLETAQYLDRDLQRLDALDTLVVIQEEHIQGFLKLVAGKDAELAIHVEMEKQLNAVIRDKSEKEIASADLCALNIKTAKKRGRREGAGAVLMILLIGWIVVK